MEPRFTTPPVAPADNTSYPITPAAHAAFNAHHTEVKNDPIILALPQRTHPRLHHHRGNPGRLPPGTG